MVSRNVGQSLLSGMAGAVALTLVHQAAKRFSPNAPQMDRLGRRVIARGLESAGIEPPHKRNLQRAALAGDLLSNSAYYALLGALPGRRPMAGGTLLGSLAGMGALLLPPLLGLGRKPQGRTPQTKAMTFAWYLLGGVASALAYKLFDKDRDDQR